jgi:3-deoxy-7-phosphoheptulonate synthase
MVDCSHANSSHADKGRDPDRQPAVATTVVDQRRAGNDGIRGIMLESHLVGGRQDLGGELVYGMSITDGCLGFDQTRTLLRELATRLG